MATTSPGGGFGPALTLLFVQAGRPTLRTAATAVKRPGVSVQRISDWRRGRHIPREFEVVEPLIHWLNRRALDNHATGLLGMPEWRELWAAELASDPVDAPAAEERSVRGLLPFPGLAAMGPEDAYRFFGREDAVAALVGQLDAIADDDEQRIVVVTGVSGAGKSSVLGAGLAGAPEPWNRPTRLRLEEGALVGDDIPDARFIVIDQFEDVFSMDADAKAAVLADVGERASTRIVVLGVRADFFDASVDVPMLAKAWQERSVIVGEMSDAQLRNAITGPIHNVGGRIDSGLADLMIRDLHEATGAGDRAGRLPLLAHALQAVWARRTTNGVSVAGYRKIGGIRSAIGHTAEAAWGRLDEADREPARALLLSMVQFGPRGVPMRHSMCLDELRRRFPDRADRIVDEFSDARLLIAGPDAVTLIHDAVLTAWPRLAGWVDDDFELLQWGQQLTADAEAWRDGDRRAEYLYTGGRLESSLENLDRLGGLRKHLLPEGTEEFLDAAVRQRRTRRGIQIGAVALVIMLALAATTAAVIANSQAGDLERERNSAEHAALLSSIDGIVRSDPSLAARLLLAADRRYGGDPAVRADLMAAANAPLAVTVDGHTGPVYDVTYSRDGGLVATASNDRTVRLWRHTDRPGEPLRQIAEIGGFDDYVTSTAFHPRLPLLAAASGDGIVRLWNIADPAAPRRIGEMRTGRGTAYLTRFSPSGDLLATTSDDGTISLFRIEGADAAPTVRTDLRGHTQAVRTVAFDAGGGLLASGGDDQTVRLWRIGPDGGAPVGEPLRGFPSITHSLAFLPRTEILAVTGDSPNVQLWDVGDPAAPRPVSRAVPNVTAGSWSLAADPGAPYLAQAGNDGIVHVWNVTSPGEPQSVWELENSVARGAVRMLSTAFAPGGGELAVGRSDGGVDVWRLPGGALPDRGGTVTGVAQAFSAPVMATVGTDSRLNVWRRDAGEWRRRGGIAVESRVNDRPRVAISDDGSLVSTANNNGGSVELWDTADPDRPRRGAVLRVDTRYTSAMAFGRPQRLLATVSTDRTVQLWDVADPFAPKAIGDPLDGPTDLIRAIAFSPDGTAFAVSSDDGRAYLYDTRTRRPLHVLDIGTPGADVLFSPSGEQVLVAGRDLSVWRVRDGALVDRLGDVHAESLAVGGRDGEATLLAGTGTREILAFSLASDGTLDDRRGVTPILGGPRSTTVRWELPEYLGDAVRYVTGGDGTGLLYSSSTTPGEGRAWVCGNTQPLTPQQRDRYRIADGEDDC